MPQNVNSFWHLVNAASNCGLLTVEHRYAWLFHSSKTEPSQILFIAQNFPMNVILVKGVGNYSANAVYVTYISKLYKELSLRQDLFSRLEK